MGCFAIYMSSTGLHTNICKSSVSWQISICMPSNRYAIHWMKDHMVFSPIANHLNVACHPLSSADHMLFSPSACHLPVICSLFECRLQYFSSTKKGPEHDFVVICMTTVLWMSCGCHILRPVYVPYNIVQAIFTIPYIYHPIFPSNG